ncbi:MAG TPA: DUF721 domain-containing protein [Bacteroidota bacterium]|nr:DUF721 domain-containing protein [Bacteroidota bacterium]
MRKRAASHIKSIGDALDDLINSLGIQKKLQEQSALDKWDQAVGARIAGVARPTRILHGTLYISVTSSVWRNELNLRKAEILGKLNAELEEEIVKDIKFQ